MANLQKIKSILKEKGLTVRYLANELGISEQGLQKLIRENSTKIETLEAIANILKVSISVFFDKEASTDSGNNYNGSGIQTIAGGNIGNGSVHIAMPESGTQKIIKPNGEIEIQRTDSAIKDDKRLAELSKELELMKQKMALMEDNMKMKDDLIASLKDANAVLKDSIELLRDRQ